MRGSGFVHDLGGARCVFVGAESVNAREGSFASTTASAVAAAVVATVLSREEVHCLSPERSQLSVSVASGGGGSVPNQTAYLGQAVSVEVTVVRRDTVHAHTRFHMQRAPRIAPCVTPILIIIPHYIILVPCTRHPAAPLPAALFIIHRAIPVPCRMAILALELRRLRSSHTTRRKRSRCPSWCRPLALLSVALSSR